AGTGPAPPGLAVPSCDPMPLTAAGPCIRAAARVWLAGGAPDGPPHATALLGAGPARPLDRYYLALAEDRAGDRAAALRDWRTAGAENAVLAPGRALIRNGDYAAAVREFTRVLAALPDDGWAYLERGRARSALGNWPEARDDFVHAAALDAGPVALTELGAARWYADRG